MTARSSSATRCCARRCTTMRRQTTGAPPTTRSPGRSRRSATPTGGHGTERRQPRPRTRRWRSVSSGRPCGRGAEAKLYVTGLVISSALALVVTSLVFAGKPGYILGMTPEISAVQPPSEFGVAVGLLFWTVMTLFASALPVRMPRGTIVSVSFATVVAAMILGGPVAAGWVAAIGTTEMREAARSRPLVRGAVQSRSDCASGSGRWAGVRGGSRRFD